MVALGITTTTVGPLLDGSAPAIVGDILDESQRVIASKAFSEVHLNLDQSIRNPTPYYETQVVSERVADDIVIHDRGIVYGPWLEGVSRRNQTTRFKGYASFRRARQRIEGQIPEIVGQVVGRYLRQLGARS